MTDVSKSDHLDVYSDRFELHQGNDVRVFYEGFQNDDTKERYAKINEALSNDYLANQMNNLHSVDLSDLDESNKQLLRNMVNGITSEVGRALVGLAFLQLTIKSICPDQCIRLHKGTTRRGSFSWTDGISMRTIDSAYNTPFLREQGLLNINKYGIMMTRSLAENYPYSRLYKAEMRGPFDDWIAIVDALENETMPADLGLAYMMMLLKNRSDNFQELADKACALARSRQVSNIGQAKQMLKHFFDTTSYSTRAFEVVLHGLYQAMDECDLLGDLDVVPMSQMRSANKKHGNVGDIELVDSGTIVEAWDAKYGKPYLRDEIEELRDKLLTHPDVEIAGFVVDSTVDLRPDIKSRVEEIKFETGSDILLLTFDEWVDYELVELDCKTQERVANSWINAVVESFAQRRSDIAPIDEPCDAWINDLVALLSK